MDVHAAYEPIGRDSGCCQELQVEADQPRVTVDEADLLGATTRLALGALTPVGDSACDQDLPFVELADLTGGRVSNSLSPDFTAKLLVPPERGDAIGVAPAGLFVAKAACDAAYPAPTATLSPSTRRARRQSRRRCAPWPAGRVPSRAARPSPAGAWSTSAAARRGASRPASELQDAGNVLDLATRLTGNAERDRLVA